MNGNPTAEQARFHDWCRVYGCIVSGSPHPAIHHIKGSKMKLKHCTKPGEWYVLPLHYNYHQGRHGVHTNKRRFEELYGTEKEKWVKLMEMYHWEHGKYPMSNVEFEIIKARA